jgi:hypothetical protein
MCKSRVDSIYLHTNILVKDINILPALNLNKHSANKFYQEYTTMKLLVMSQKICVCEILNQSYAVSREQSSGEYWLLFCYILKIISFYNWENMRNSRMHSNLPVSVYSQTSGSHSVQYHL